MRRPPIRIRLDDDLYAALQRYATQRKLSVNQAGRQLISRGIQRLSPDKADDRDQAT